MNRDQVLWGMRNEKGSVWIKISGGTLSQCRRQFGVRSKERGWCGLVIEHKGVHPCDPHPKPAQGDAKP